MMHFKFFLIAGIFCGSMGCAHESKRLISETYIDSLIKNYQQPVEAGLNDNAMQFWKNRINPDLPGFVSEIKYAGTLSMRFHLYGDIQDIRAADSVMQKIDRDFNHREARADLLMVNYSILQHRFQEADKWLEKAKENGLKKYDQITASFDVDFELGRYFNAYEELKQLKSSSDYGYFFRRSKMDHFNGLLDSSIYAMMQAANSEKDNPYLEQVALSNAADLYIHAGNLRQAAILYKTCIQKNASDFHSMIGLGWIALAADKNDSLAEKIFLFVQSKNKLPDAFYKLTQMAEARGDTSLQCRYARNFVNHVADTVYGNMYNKYLIELYTNILHEPSRAEKIAEEELKNRATPQTHAWYVWALFSNNKKAEAYQQFQKNVSGRPLEGLELYWMGKMMQGMNKGYNAQAFFKAAYLNKYDLSPSILQDLEKRLD